MKVASLMKQYLWTLDGGRLSCQSGENTINWLFLPGGPGLGSEAIAGLTELLKNKIPGTIWHLDLPNDGSNILKDKPIAKLHHSILQATSAFEKVILVAHSTPGMYVQTMPELENILAGLVLIGTAPDSSWQEPFVEYCKNHTDDFILKAEEKYANSPDDESLKQLLVACAKYCFINERSLCEGKTLFEKLPINNTAHMQSSELFDSKKYKATWVPQKTPTLIITGSHDHITPISHFKNNTLYQRNNILIKEITDAGHYPWFENPKEIIDSFEYFSRKFSTHK